MVLLHPCSAAVTESAAISKISRIIGAFSIYKFGVLELGAFGGRFHDDYTWRIFLFCQSKFLFGILKTALLHGNPDDRADTGIGTVYLPSIGADATQAGGVGHMRIEKTGCPQPPPACPGLGVEVGTFGTGIGSGSGNAGSDGIKQIFRLCPAENEDPIEGAFAAGGFGNVVRWILVGHCENLRLIFRGTLLINKALPKQMRHSFDLHFWCFHDTR